MTMPLTSRQRVRFLRMAVADLSAELVARNAEPTSFIRDHRAAREARIAIDMASAGQLDDGAGE